VAHIEHGKCEVWQSSPVFKADMLALPSLAKDRKYVCQASIGVKPLQRCPTLALSLCVVCIILPPLPSTRRAPCRVVLRSKPGAGCCIQTLEGARKAATAASLPLALCPTTHKNTTQARSRHPATEICQARRLCTSLTGALPALVTSGLFQATRRGHVGGFQRVFH